MKIKLYDFILLPQYKSDSHPFGFYFLTYKQTAEASRKYYMNNIFSVL